MAQFYPESIAHLDSRYDAEKKVFECLKGLDNSYHVFHSVAWSADRDGECDFVVLHELKGLVCLEVKGGRVEYNGGVWTSRDGRGEVHRIKDPVRQAKSALYAVRSVWEKRYGEELPGNYGWGVCFLDGAWDRAYRTMELDEYNVLDASGLERVGEWFDKFFGVTERRHGKSLLSTTQSGRLRSLFRGEIRVPLSIQRAIMLQEEYLREADRFQDYLLDLFEDKTRIGMQGAAGTGKTWVAMKKARRLAAEGKTSLFLCYNTALNAFLADAMSDAPAVRVATFHSFALGVIREYLALHMQDESCRACFFNCVGEIAARVMPGKKKPEGDAAKDLDSRLSGALFVIRDLPAESMCRGFVDGHGGDLPDAVRSVMGFLLPDGGSDFYSDRIPLALMSVFESDPKLRLRHSYDALIIDEAQDFHKNWCESLRYLVDGHDSRVCYIFYDDNQTIFTRGSELPVTGLISTAGLEHHIFRLKDNLRNTGSIHHYAVESTGLGKTSRPLEIPGLDPVVRQVTGGEQAVGEATRILEELVGTHGIAADRIVILSNRSFDNSALAGLKQLGSHTLVRKGRGARMNSVRFRTIAEFKGLESDVVILLSHRREGRDDGRHTSPEQHYVGATRAKHLLYVIVIT